MSGITKFILFTFLFTAGPHYLTAQKQMEKLGRGIVALNAGSNKIYVGWRFLGNDPSGLAFNLYKSEGAAAFVKVNTSPMLIRTDTVIPNCNLSVLNRFYVKPVLNGVEQEASSVFSLPAGTPVRQYVRSIPLQIHAEGVLSTSNAMPGDLDGDGEPELVVMREGAGGDTARMMIESYKLDGTYLWRFEFGKNINHSNEHNAQAYYVVYDFDGDGKSEVCVRGSERSVFQAGSMNERMVGDVLIKDGITLYPLTASLQRPSAPEYLFMLDGLTGKSLDSIKYEPAMGPAASYNITWGPNERPYYQWMSVAYLDGKYPSIVTQRGIGDGYRFKVYGFDFRNGRFSMRSDSLVTNEPIAFGGHSIRIKDIDNDGKDEILFTGAAVDNDMKLIYNQEQKGIGHGDGFQIMDIDPDRPGMEWFAIQQSTFNFIGANYWDAATGDILKKYYMNTPSDPSRGDAAPISPNIRGAQMYGGTQGVMDAKGNYVNKQSFIPCGTVFWDADLAKELIENANSYRTLTLKKYDPATGNANIIFNFDTDGAGNGTMAGATYYGDLMGDWREEVVAEATENNNLVLRIYTTTTQSNNRYYTLLHNPSYRTHLTCLGRIGGFYPDFYFGPGMTATPPAPCFDEDIRWNGQQSVWDNGKATSWVKKTGIQTFSAGNKVLFDDYGINGTVANKQIVVAENVEPSEIVLAVHSDYILTGSGNITGTAQLLKNGKGTFTINTAQSFSGNTTVWDGQLVINNQYNSPVTVFGGIYGGYQTKGASGGRLSGSGKLMQSVVLDEKGGIIPGNAENRTDTFRIQQHLTMKRGSYLFLDMGNSPEVKHDLIRVGGNLNITDTVFIVINSIADLNAGTYPLINFAGTFTGSLNKIKIVGIENQFYSLDNNSGSIQLVVNPTRKPASIVWGGVINKWAKTTEKNWYLNATAESYVPNDSIVFDETGKQQPDILLEGDLPCSNILINSNTNYMLSGNGLICGAGGLKKSGSGKLTILTNNTFTGPVEINGGSIEIRNNVMENTASPFGASSAAPSGIRMFNSQLRFNAPIAMGFERGMTISGNDTIYSLNTVAFSGQITGTGKLIKTGAGKVNFVKQNSYTGGTFIKEGIITFADNNNPLGSGLITFGGGKLIFCDNSGNTETFSTPFEIPSGVSAGIDLDSRMVFSSTLTGGGILNLWSPFIRADLKGNWSAFTGTINVTTDSDGGDFRIMNSYGYGNALVTLGSKVNAYPNGSYQISYGALASTVTDATVTTPFTVGTKNTNATYAGLINGTGSVTKKGTGEWTLTNANTYSGGTNIEGGTIFLTNTSGSATGTGVVTVKSNGTLAGTGTVSGSVSVQANGTIMAGNSTSNGTINIGTNLVISNSGFLAAKLNADINTCDVINVTGNTSLTGTILKLTKRSGTYSVGDKFKLINCSTITGTISGILPEKPAEGLYWDVSELFTTGTIKISNEPSAVLKTNYNNIPAYPNPFSGSFSVQMPVTDNYRVNVYDVSGQKIYVHPAISASDFEIDLSGFKPGMYLLEMQSDKEIYVQKLVKKQ